MMKIQNVKIVNNIENFIVLANKIKIGNSWLQVQQQLYFCLFDLNVYVPVNNLSVMLGQIFLG